MNATTLTGGMGMRTSGTFAGAFAQIGSFSNYTGVMRGLSSSTALGTASAYVAVSTYSTSNSTAVLFDNIKIDGVGITYIFRPFTQGTATSTTAIVGIHNGYVISTSGINIGNPNPTAGIYWRYKSGTSTDNWELYADKTLITSISESAANNWCKILIIRTGINTFSSSFTIIGISTTTGSGSVASESALTYNGWIWGNNGSGSAGSKCMDIDYISAEFNSK